MTGAQRSAAADVEVMLGRACAAGLAVGWTALASRGGSVGRMWCAGVSGLGATPVTPDLLWDVASLTKPLAGTTLLLLARRDGLDLEMPLADLLPELAGSPWGGAPLWRCATHTAGFPAWAPLYASGELTRDSYLDALCRLSPVHPGTEVVYSDLGFIALGIALERAGGAEVTTLFAELVAEPLGLADEAVFAPPPASPVAAGEGRWRVEERLLAERGIRGTPPPAVPGSLPCDDGNARGLAGIAAHAGLFATAATIARLAAEYLPGGGELITSEEAELATRCWTAGLAQARGLGWQLAASPGCSAGPALSDLAFGHTGFTGASVWADPTDRAVLVLLGNRLHPGGRTPDLHPLRRRFHRLGRYALS